MRTVNKIMVVGLVAGLMLSGTALADPWRGHRHGGGPNIGFYFGPGFGPGFYGPGWGPYYPRPYYGVPTYPYYPPVIVAPAPAPVPPPVYIEQAPQQSAAPQSADSAYWYHCNQPEGYYPYIKECPSGWQKVAPQPPQ
ncbi:hypothetical protein LG198_08745 [Methylobacillus arboreus]|uniref:hypothetical protein n=1 Tax=Methylobacillus arboreus TaxID=755170 RepID=UPI001E2AD45E|nr:hypothetical protein [Methylobacillus arboreus]MCB5190811.1 hypothetical protein [Methylobacillus arboreus]